MVLLHVLLEAGFDINRPNAQGASTLSTLLQCVCQCLHSLLHGRLPVCTGNLRSLAALPTRRVLQHSSLSGLGANGALVVGVSVALTWRCGIVCAAGTGAPMISFWSSLRFSALKAMLKLGRVSRWARLFVHCSGMWCTAPGGCQHAEWHVVAPGRAACIANLRAVVRGNTGYTGLHPVGRACHSQPSLAQAAPQLEHGFCLAAVHCYAGRA